MRYHKGVETLELIGSSKVLRNNIISASCAPPKLTTTYEENRSGGEAAVASDGEFFSRNRARRRSAWRSRLCRTEISGSDHGLGGDGLCEGDEAVTVIHRQGRRGAAEGSQMVGGSSPRHLGARGWRWKVAVGCSG